MKKYLCLILPLFIIIIFTACSSQTEQPEINVEQNTQNVEQPAETPEPSLQIEQPNISKSFTLDLSENFYTGSHYDIIEISDKIVVAYSVMSEKSPDKFETVIEFLDKSTGEKINGLTISESYVARSLEYDKKTDGVQFKTIGDFDCFIYSIDNNYNMIIHDIPENLLSEEIEQLNESNYAYWQYSQNIFSFDGTPEFLESNPNNAWWAVSNSEGIFVQPIEGNQNSEFFISNEIINDEYDFPVYDDIPPAHFSDVKLMRGGEILVATVVSPMAQSGNVGLYTLNIKTGEETWYKDIFSAMVASVDYQDDNTVVAFGYDFVTFIDLNKGEKEVLQTPEFTFFMTYDFENFFDTSLENGTENLYITNSGLGIEKQILKQFDTPSIYVMRVTENFVFVALDDGECVAVSY